MNIRKEVNKIKEVWGINAYEKIMEILGKQEIRIEELIKSRQNWREKYEELKKSQSREGNSVQ